MNGFKETEKEKDCTKCRFFVSFNSEYADDLEPTEYGRCENEKNQDLDETFGEGSICDLWETLRFNEA